MLDRGIVVLMVAALASSAAIVLQYNRIILGQVEAEKSRGLFLSRKNSIIAGYEEQHYLKANYQAAKNAVTKKSSDAQQKLKWLKVLESVKSELGISELALEIYPQRPAIAHSTDLLVSVGVTTINIKVSLLHDGKLTDFISYLRENAPEKFVVTSFSIERVDRTVDNGITNPKKTLLEAEFTLEQYALSVAGSGGDA